MAPIDKIKKFWHWILVVGSIPATLGALSIIDPPCSTTPMVYNSTEYRIFRYLAKLEQNRGTAYWDNPNVQRILTNGKPDINKVKELFLERGIGAGFDEALNNLESRSDIKNFKINPNCLTRYEGIEAERKLDVIDVNKKIKTLEQINAKTY